MDWQKLLLLGTSNVIFLWEFYLSWRQHRRILAVKKLPTELKQVLTGPQFQQSRLYSEDKSGFGLIQQVYSHLIWMAILYWDGLSWLWYFCAQLTGFQDHAHEIPHSLIFIALYVVGYHWLPSLPFSLYSTFVIEQRHGFNQQSLGLYIQDQVKMFMLFLSIGLPVISGLIYITQHTGPHFYLYLFIFFLTIQLFLYTVYPVFIQPLFYTMQPLPQDSSLRKRVEELASKVKFPLDKILVMDAGKRSRHSNAYFYGLWGSKQQIVLFDTLLEQVTDEDEVLAVLGHEIGHWKFAHVSRMMIISQIHSLILFTLFSKFHQDASLFQAFGFSVENDYMPTIIGFILFSLLYSPVEAVLGLLMNVISRYHEFQADKFAADLGMAEPLEGALKKLAVENRGMIWPDWLFSVYHHSHPPLLERLQALQRLDSARKKKTDDE